MVVSVMSATMVGFGRSTYKREYKFWEACYHIKEAKFVGYRGGFNHLKMIERFVKHGDALDNIIVDPRSLLLLRNMVSHNNS